MTHMRALLVIALPLLTAASDRTGGPISAPDFAEGSLSFLVSKRCGYSRSHATKDDATKEVEWTGLVYAAGKQPAWGRKRVGPCQGLDTWVLSESVGAGALWTARPPGDRGRSQRHPLRPGKDARRVQESLRLGAARSGRRPPPSRRIPQVRRQKALGALRQHLRQAERQDRDHDRAGGL